MSKLRIGVIGAGHLGRIHAKLLGQVDGAELVAISDPVEAARNFASKQFSVPALADYRDVIPMIDAAIVAAPTDAHADIATDLLEANKHVLVEKPLTTERSDAQRLTRLSQANKLTLQVGHVERFNPAFSALGRHAVDVKYVEAVRASRFPGRCLDVGVVMDLMIHDLDLILALTDAPVARVSASGVAVISDHEDIAEARVEFECGLVANVKASRVNLAPAREMQIFGARGFASIDFSTPALTIVEPCETLIDRTFDLEEQTDNPLQYADQLFLERLPVESIELQPRNAILDELHDFVISIQSGVSPTVDGVAGARAVDLAQTIKESITARRWYHDARPTEIGPHARVRTRIDDSARRAA